MTVSRKTGPRVVPQTSTGPRIAMPQPGTPPTTVHLGNDRLLNGAREVDVSQLSPDPDQPRKYMQPERLAQLAASIVAHGVLQPLVARQDGMGRDGDMRYIIVAGGRRLAAIRLALETTTDDVTRHRLVRVPIVLSESPAAQRRVIQLIENLQREDLNPIEEARAFKEIMRLELLSTEGVAARVHRSQGYVDERLRLLRHEEVEEAVESGVLTKSAAAAVASVRDSEARRAWIDRARLGEIVRPRDVYASKPNRRLAANRSAPAVALGPNGDSRVGGEVQVPQSSIGIDTSRKDETLLSTGERARSLPDIERSKYAGGWAQAMQALAELEVAVPPLAEKFVGVTPEACLLLIANQWASESDNTRAALETLLATGVLLGMSCEQFLRALKSGVK